MVESTGLERTCEEEESIVRNSREKNGEGGKQM